MKKSRSSRKGNGPPAAPRRGWVRPAEVGLWVLVAVAAAWRMAPQVRRAVGVDAPEGTRLEVETVDGERLDLADLRGDVVLVNFWATWCPPCRLEMPGFESVYEDYRDRGFHVVGLSADRMPPGSVRAFLRGNGIRYPVAMVTEEADRLFGGVPSLPTSFLLDRQGRVRQTVRGVFTEWSLRRAVDALLAEEDG